MPDPEPILPADPESARREPATTSGETPAASPSTPDADGAEDFIIGEDFHGQPTSPVVDENGMLVAVKIGDEIVPMAPFDSVIGTPEPVGAGGNADESAISSAFQDHMPISSAYVVIEPEPAIIDPPCDLCVTRDEDVRQRWLLEHDYAHGRRDNMWRPPAGMATRLGLLRQAQERREACRAGHQTHETVIAAQAEWAERNPQKAAEMTPAAEG